MELLSLGKSNIKISQIIMGTWQAGKDMWAGIDDEETTRAIRAAFDSGITTFDTAEGYGNGHSERIVGGALKALRERVVIATKVFPNRFKHNQIIRSCEKSLHNLKTDYIDLYQLHWPSGSFGTKKVPVEETMEAMNELKEQGKIRSIGVSNFSRGQIEEAGQYGRIDSLQPPYSLFWRKVEKDATPYCVENNITVLAYSPMAQGILTGKFGTDPQFEKGDHRVKNKLLQQEHYGRVLKALDKLRPIAEGYEITMGQLALAWVVSHKGTCAIAGARNEGQVRQNAIAADVKISEEDLDGIDRISRSVTDHLDDSPLMWEF